MMERVRNVIKRDSKKMNRELPQPSEPPEPKRRYKGVELLRRYPVVTSSNLESEDVETMERHRKAITSELAKAKPRDPILLPLMKWTYGERRMFILNEATSVGAILTKYPGLSRPALVCCILHKLCRHHTSLRVNYRNPHYACAPVNVHFWRMYEPPLHVKP